MLTETRPPTSDENLNGNWTGVVGSRYAEVDDYPDTSAGLTLSASNGNVTFGFTAFALPNNATDILVFVDYYDKEASAGTNKLTSRLKVGGVYYNFTPTHNPSTGIKHWNNQWTNNPATGLAWTPTAVNAIQAFGVRSSDAVPSLELLSLQLRTTYTIPGPPEIPPGHIRPCCKTMFVTLPSFRKRR